MAMQADGQRRIVYIVGAQCTGKTTLVNELAKDVITDTANCTISPHAVPEVARVVLNQHSFNAEELRTSPQRALALQKLMIQAQAEAERRALEVAEEASWC